GRGGAAGRGHVRTDRRGLSLTSIPTARPNVTRRKEKMLPSGKKTAIVGTGLSRIARRAEVGVGALAVEACQRALEEAGLPVEAIDGIATYPNPSRVGAGNTDGVDFVDVNYIARALDLKQLRWHCSITQGTVTAALIQA